MCDSSLLPLVMLFIWLLILPTSLMPWSVVSLGWFFWVPSKGSCGWNSMNKCFKQIKVQQNNIWRKIKYFRYYLTVVTTTEILHNHNHFTAILTINVNFLNVVWNMFNKCFTQFNVWKNNFWNMKYWWYNVKIAQ